MGTDQKSVIVWGPKGSGKTKNAEALKKHFGLRKIHDGASKGDRIDKFNTLILTNEHLALEQQTDRRVYHVIEVKTCNQLPDRIKTQHLAQSECYLRAFDKKVAVMYIVPSRSGWETKVFPYEKNDKLWDFTMAKVCALHEKLQQYA